MSSVREGVLKLQNELDELISRVKEAQKTVADQDLLKSCEDVVNLPPVNLWCRRNMKGHLGKVTCVYYGCEDSRTLCSGSLDSKLILWDTWTNNKSRIIPLQSSWTMTCCLSPDADLVASGGMDNQCTIHDTRSPNSEGPKIVRELLGFQGFLSCVRFLDDTKIITSSADGSIFLWDIITGSRIAEFSGHASDVLSISIAKPSLNLFVSGSVDHMAKLWDIRTATCRQTFWGHSGDVNGVDIHPEGNVFATASEDESCRLFDIRSDQELVKMGGSGSKYSSVGLSSSCRLLLTGAEDNKVHIYDTLKGCEAGVLNGHSGRITSLSLNMEKTSLATGSWDMSIRVWA